MKAVRPLLLSTACAIALLILASAAFAADAGKEARLKALEFSLAQANLSQQAVHTQFQMIGEIRRTEAEQYKVAIPEAGIASPPRNYNDLVQMRAENERRLQQAADELNRLYDRFSAIEQEKERLREQIRALLEER